MSEDPNDNLVLTPWHFLNQQFCTRWKQEYELQKRNMWKLPSENLSEGMIVVVREENLPPNEWKLGRIENVVVGKDSLARIADVRTDRGIIRRPIIKLVVLPTNSSFFVIVRFLLFTFQKLYIRSYTLLPLDFSHLVSDFTDIIIIFRYSKY